MSDPQSELRPQIKAIDAKLDRFEQQAATTLVITLTLSVAIYLILLQVLP